MKKYIENSYSAVAGVVVRLMVFIGIMFVMASAASALERLEPPDGCYFGVGIGFDSGEWDPIDTTEWWSQRMGGMHAGAYEYFTDYPVEGEDIDKIEAFMSQVIPHDSIAIITLRPFVGLTNLTVQNAVDFSTMCQNWEDQGVGGIMVRFGNEMNAGWFPWGQQPRDYKEQYRILASNVHARTTRTAMIWDPNEGDGFPYPYGEYCAEEGSQDWRDMNTNGDQALTAEDDMYTPFYPGDDAVDWVGMSSYFWGLDYPWGENEVPHHDKFVAQIRGLEQTSVRNFYDMFCRDGVHNKPLMISETAALYNSAESEGADELEVKRAWWEQLYNVHGDNTNSFDVSEHLPKLKMICWFDRITHETEIEHDRIVWSFSEPSDVDAGWIAENHAWLEDFEHVDSWWAPWGVVWTNSDSIYCEGSNSLLLQGVSIAESNKYIGGSGRSIGESYFDTGKIVANFESLDVNGWDGQPTMMIEDFEHPDTWNKLHWGFSWSLTGDVCADDGGTNAILMSGATQSSSNDYVGGNTRPIQVSLFNSSQTIAEMQDLTAQSTNTSYSSAEDVDPFDTISPWEGVGHQWSIKLSTTNDCYDTPNAALLEHNGTISADGWYIGGAMRNYTGNWTNKNGMLIWLKRQTGTATDPKFQIELVDSAANSVVYKKNVTNTTYQMYAVTFDEFETSGSFNWGAITALKIHLIATVEGQKPAAVYIDNWQIANNITKDYPDEVDWNVSWDVEVSCVDDPADGMLPKSMRIYGGTNTVSTNNHIGGIRGTLRNEYRDWSTMEAVRVVMRRGTNQINNPELGISLVDTSDRCVNGGQLAANTEYFKFVIPKTNMTIAAGFDWNNVKAIQLNMGTTNIGTVPADIYVKSVEIGTLTDAETPSDWSAYDGVEIWAQRENSSEPNPVLALEVVSGIYTANAARTVSSKGAYEPLRIYYSDFTVPSGFSWANITDLRVGMLSVTNGIQPGDLYMDAWSVVSTETDLHDQDWWPSWADDADPTGTNEFEFALENDPQAGTNVLAMSGLDLDNLTNTTYGYIGGSGFSVRAFDNDWSDYTHFKMMVRQDGTGTANPVVQVEFTDKAGRTAHIGRIVDNTDYARLVCAFDDMEPEAGFDWSQIEDVKLELLVDVAHETPAKVYIQDFVLGVLPNESPSDWSTYNGMEIKIRRANLTNTPPMVKITVESIENNVTNGTAFSFLTIRDTNATFKAMKVPFVEMHKSVDPFPWDNITSLKLELFSEVTETMPDAVYLDDWSLVNLHANPDDEIRNSFTDYVRQLDDGKRYFMFAQDPAYQRLVSPYAAWTRGLASIIPLEDSFTVQLPVNVTDSADVVVELYNSTDTLLAQGRTTVSDIGRTLQNVTLNRTIGGALPDRSTGYYYKAYVTSVGGDTGDALAVSEQAVTMVRDLESAVQILAVPKILRPGDELNIIVQYASAKAGNLCVQLVDSENCVRGSGQVFVQGGSSIQWVRTVISSNAPSANDYTLRCFLSETTSQEDAFSEVESSLVYVKTYVDFNDLFYVAPKEVNPNETIKIPVGYTITSNKHNIFMELVDEFGTTVASEEDAVYDGNGTLELMVKPGNYPPGNYSLRMSIRDDFWDKELIETNGTVITNWYIDHYTDYLIETNDLIIRTPEYASWVSSNWVNPVFSDPTCMDDDANRDRESNYDEYLSDSDPLEDVDTHYEFTGAHEPLRGVYLAAFINGNSDTLEEIEEFAEKAGKGVAVYGRFVDLYDNCYPAEWMERIHYNYPGAGVHLVLEPWMAFTNFYGANWAPGNDTYEQARAFIDGCASSGLPVFLRFAHEANGWWYPWSPASRATDITAAQYIEGWRNFAQMAHERAPNVAMVWAPNQGSCDRSNPNNVDPDALADYSRIYPGDAYVDWVGMSMYNGSWYNNGDEVQDYQLGLAIHDGYTGDTFQDFYWTFSDPDNPDGHKKPMMVAETSFQYVPKYALSNSVDIARFESIDGPEIINVENTPYEGMETADTNTYWNWQSWDYASITETTYCVEGTYGLRMYANATPTNNDYFGGFGRGITNNAPVWDWSDYGGICMALCRGTEGDTNPIFKIEVKDIHGNKAEILQEISWDEYENVQLYLDRFNYPDGFAWDSVVGFSFHLFTPQSNVTPADVYMDNMQMSVLETLPDQEWVASWDLNTWEQTDVSVSGKALRMGGAVTNGGTYVGGCLAIISREDRAGWEESDALAFYVRRGGYSTNWGEQPDPKLKILLDADWDDKNGTEASIEFKISNAEYAQMIIPFEDFQMGDDFEWGTVNKMAFHMMTSEGPNPFDIYIDEIRRTTAVVTNANDDLSIKADWMDQLYGLLENNTVSPYYHDISRKYRNIHMVNWFHIRKIEDGEMRDFRLPEYEGETPLYKSYYERIQSPYFLTNVVTDRSGDGIPDDWAEIYFGNVTNAVGDLDTDGDGFSNWQEYIAGTSPLDAGSLLWSCGSRTYDGQSIEGDAFVLEWPSADQRTYSIGFTTNLMVPMDMLITNIPATPPMNVYTGKVSGYYRINVVP